MKTEELLDALGKIDPVYIEEAEKTRFAGHARKRLKYYVPAAACAALLMLGGAYGIGQLNGGMHQEGAMDSAAVADEAAEDAQEAAVSAAPDGTAENAAGDAIPEAAAADTAGASDMADQAAEESVSGALEESANGKQDADYAVSREAETVWKVNEVEELQMAVACGTAPEKTEYYTAEELEGYYGIRILPDALPEGYAAEEPEQGYAVGYDGSGNVIDDNCKAVYRNEKDKAEFTVSARTVDMGEMTDFAETGLETSEIGGTTVTVGHYRTTDSDGRQTDGYLAVYGKEGVTVTVQSTGMDEAAFRSVLEDLLL